MSFTISLLEQQHKQKFHNEPTMNDEDDKMTAMTSQQQQFHDQPAANDDDAAITMMTMMP